MYYIILHYSILYYIMVYYELRSGTACCCPLGHKLCEHPRLAAWPRAMPGPYPNPKELPAPIREFSFVPLRFVPWSLGPQTMEYGPY